MRFVLKFMTKSLLFGAKALTSNNANGLQSLQDGLKMLLHELRQKQECFSKGFCFGLVFLLHCIITLSEQFLCTKTELKALWFVQKFSLNSLLNSYLVYGSSHKLVSFTNALRRTVDPQSKCIRGLLIVYFQRGLLFVLIFIS